ncbi:5'-adenylylsulfate reductase-like 3 [Selaginella moellendorffii]|uniref:5'-adenylylsulfate reductase-like 3 n=1 Tax=Selaginella moellendorffii TaxID=88036 RepID=UPI000D1CF313|nr:5'-adenylylsulfate reductase-like 3 [Selaginella moellendorffii]|eukprot:XP_024541306.1 5'-adenylylsulfate reductase-like 3 [Selaginella moellendorffii]
MRTSFMLLLFALAIAASTAAVVAAAVAAPVCPVPSLEELLLPLRDSCPKITRNAVPRIWSTSPSRVIELGEGALEQALSNETFTAVLYYATWCQFSKQLKPMFETLSMMFPTIFHVAVEESSIRPGVLSKYGVYSFPVLCLHSGSSRFRYSGPRTLEDLTMFYANITDMPPSKLVKAFGAENSTSSEPALSERLQNDSYLVLASWFLILRILLLVLPVAVNRVKNFWERCHLYRMMKPRGLNDNQGVAERGFKHRRRLSVPGWSHQITSPSSSLAIAESSTRRIGPAEDLGGRIM